MAKPEPAECPCCDQLIRRGWVMTGRLKTGMKFRSHTAPCGLPCKLPSEAEPGEVTHTITEECLQCQTQRRRTSKIFVDGNVYEKSDDPRKFAPTPTMPVPIKFSAIPPEPKVPWEKIIIPAHALKMMKIRAGFTSVIDAAMMIERLYPLTVYNSSQKKAGGTSHTKRTKPGKAKHKSQRVDLYTVTDEGIQWIFYMKRNVLMTVHRNDEFDYGGPRVDNCEPTDND